MHEQIKQPPTLTTVVNDTHFQDVIFTSHATKLYQAIAYFSSAFFQNPFQLCCSLQYAISIYHLFIHHQYHHFLMHNNRFFNVFLASPSSLNWIQPVMMFSMQEMDATERYNIMRCYAFVVMRFIDVNLNFNGC